MTSAAPTPSVTLCARGLCVAGCGHRAPDDLQVLVCREWLRAHAEPRIRMNTRSSADSVELARRIADWSARRGVVWMQTDDAGRGVGSVRLRVTQGAVLRAALLEGYRIAPRLGCGSATINLRFLRESER